MIQLLAHPLPPPSRQQVVSLSLFFCLSPADRIDGIYRGGGGGGGMEPNHTYDDGEKAWASIDHSILSDQTSPWSLPPGSPKRGEFSLVRCDLIYDIISVETQNSHVIIPLGR
jgi:hypothetical protein